MTTGRKSPAQERDREGPALQGRPEGEGPQGKAQSRKNGQAAAAPEPDAAQDVGPVPIGEADAGEVHPEGAVAPGGEGALIVVPGGREVKGAPVHHVENVFSQIQRIFLP